MGFAYWYSVFICAKKLFSQNQVEQELADTNESLSDQTCTNQAICGAKMKCEQEMGSMSHDLDEMTAEAHLSEEKAQRAMIDAARLAGNLYTLKKAFRH